MTDYIDRRSAIAYAISGIVRIKDGEKWIRVKEVKESLLNMPSVQQGQQWIPCSERLPEENSDILVTYVEEGEERIVPVNYGWGTWFDCFFNKALNPVGVL